MRILNRLAVTRLLAASILLLIPAVSHAQQPPPIVERLAKTYGLDAFGQVEAIRFTFNAQLPGVDVARTWTWEPKADRVAYEGKDKSGKPVKLTYVRSKLEEQSGEIEPSFVNDQYWLLLPFHVSWDGAEVQDAGMQKLPLGNGSAEKVVVKYSSDSGSSSPGDTWELYVGGDGRIQEMVFNRGGSRKPAVVIATWADYKKAGPLLFSLDHNGTADGKPLRIFFSNVAVKLADSDVWVEPK